MKKMASPSKTMAPFAQIVPFFMHLHLIFTPLTTIPPPALCIRQRWKTKWASAVDVAKLKEFFEERRWRPATGGKKGALRLKREQKSTFFSRFNIKQKGTKKKERGEAGSREMEEPPTMNLLLTFIFQCALPARKTTFTWIRPSARPQKSANLPHNESLYSRHLFVCSPCNLDGWRWDGWG